MNVVRKVVDRFHELMVGFAKLLLVLITALTCIQVFCRYILDFSIRWSEEVPLIMMVWFGFISLAIGVKKKLHISIEVFSRLFPENIQKWIGKFVDLSIMIFGIIMIIYGWKLAAITMNSTMPATKMPTGYLYGIVPLSGILVTYDSFINLLGLNQSDVQEDEVSEALKSLSLGGNE
ncbi:MAG: TRAP transporter small permease [Firmicutes bacterium HGW-Firmicutes-1]|jgi:TRAP-type C4-dicarboxylate transport system permease small subunit|nr:MAG: TRAP transporter small permease [Firmicutes bacterium HGW-Firmicutes-1]